jgi:hypothetical protein
MGDYHNDSLPFYLIILFKINDCKFRNAVYPPYYSQNKSKIMEIKSKEDVKKLMLEKTKGNVKTVIYGKEISELTQGQGIFFLGTEWSLKTTPAAYFYNRFRKGKEKTISINKVNDGYLITKL